MIYGPGHSLGFHHNKWPLFSKHFDEDDDDDDLYIIEAVCLSQKSLFSRDFFSFSCFLILSKSEQPVGLLRMMIMYDD